MKKVKAEKAEIKKRERLVRAITHLNDRDFETIVFLLLGADFERRLAYKILADLAPECAVYCTDCSVT